VERIRILLVEEMPRMLRDIVERAVGTRPDMEVVERVEGRDALAAAVDRTPVDVAILYLADQLELPSYDAMLFDHPRIRLLALTGDGRAAAVYALRPQLDPVRVVSPNGLVDAIRAAVPISAR